MPHVLVVGGAGFIGSHTTDALIERGYDVTVLDVLHPQIHGSERAAPGHLNPGARLVTADVRDESVVRSLVRESDVIFHFAAHTGVGQSMYRVREYVDVNVVGTAALLEAVAERAAAIRRFVVASSRAVYGEGSYRCPDCGIVTPPPRTPDRVGPGCWEPACPSCTCPIYPVPTAEAAPVQPGSIYGITKADQERSCLVMGATYGFPVVALRYFNVLGGRQSLRNPYTGVIVTFINRIRAGRAPEVYEDGRESRDFVHVNDVVAANLLALERDDAVGRSFNVGSGRTVSLVDLARLLSTELGGAPPVITGAFRPGDVRHSCADLTLAREVLGYQPRVPFEDGIREFIREVAREEGEDLSSVAADELSARGLMREVVR